MVIDFSTADVKKMPRLVLRNLDGTAIQVLGCAQGLKAELNYNEVSTITFEVPRFVDGEATPDYDLIVGTRIVDLIGWGQFILSNPETVNDGIDEIKSCKAYSLEYEFTKKKLSLPSGTYCFWNPAAPDETVLGIILEYMPSWSVGDVDEELLGKYRTFDVSNVNVYDFMKGTLQTSFSCIFTFDTYQRLIHVKHTSTDADQSAVYLSLDNLAEELKITEDSDNLVTVLDVNGADGVDIRNVNPLGTNKIYNLDYYMNTSHFSQTMINKWESWKAAIASNQAQYYNLSIERMLKIAEIASAQAAVDEKRNVDLETLQQIQSAQVELLTSLGSMEFYVGLTDGYETDYREPSAADYSRQKITYWKTVDDDGQIANLAVNGRTVLFGFMQSRWFNLGNSIRWMLFLGSDSTVPIAVGSFGEWVYDVGQVPRIETNRMRVDLDHLDIADTVKNENAVTSIVTLARMLELSDEIYALKSEIASDEDAIIDLEAQRDSLRDQLIGINQACSLSNFFTDAELLILDRYFIEDSIEEASFVLTSTNAYINSGQSVKAQMVDIEVNGVDLSEIQVQDGELVVVKGGDMLVDITGASMSSITANIISLITESNDQLQTLTLTAYLGPCNIDGIDYSGGSLTISGTRDVFTITSENSFYASSIDTQLFFTENVSAYAQYSVEQELYDYGVDVLSKLAWPSYTFDVSSANFFAIDEFIAFVRSVGLGKRIYLNDDHGNILKPILVSVSLDFEDLSSLTLQFGSTYNLSDSSFQLVDLLEQSVSMGRNVDTGRFNYNAFIDSGAATSVKQFMDSALDVSKNAIISGNGQAITWDSSGIHCRKVISGGIYDSQEIAIINNSIVFTDDRWQSAKMAIGSFIDPNFGEQWGVVAPSIVGTLLAGKNLLIESTKKDGDIAVFRVDGDGAVLHNAKFDIVSGGSQIMLDPTIGIAIGEYPVIDGNGDVDIGTSNNPGNAKFWVDQSGNVHMRGSLEGCDGTFTGTVQATDFLDANGNSMLNANDQFKPDYLDLKGLTIRDTHNNVTFEVDSNGNVTIDGELVGCTGTFSGSVNWVDGNKSASIGFVSGSAGGSETQLIGVQTNSNVGILLESGTNIRIQAAQGLWLRNLPTDIHIWTGSSYTTLTAYIQSLINAT